jgi:hypothetical protein
MTARWASAPARNDSRLFAPTRHPQDGRASGEPAKLLWTVPTEAREVSVNFEFKDLPMP